MDPNQEDKTALIARIRALEDEVIASRCGKPAQVTGDTVKIPHAVRPLFDAAQTAVAEYLSHLKVNPTEDTIQSLYADRGPAEAMAIGRNFLFGITHISGIDDARLSRKDGRHQPAFKAVGRAGALCPCGLGLHGHPAGKQPHARRYFYLFYNHPYSFGTDTWLHTGTRADVPVCIMNAGYSSGWCVRKAPAFRSRLSR